MHNVLDFCLLSLWLSPTVWFHSSSIDAATTIAAGLNAISAAFALLGPLLLKWIDYNSSLGK